MFKKRSKSFSHSAKIDKIQGIVKSCNFHTMWKLQDFTATLFLREITLDFGNIKAQKTAILTGVRKLHQGYQYTLQQAMMFVSNS